MIFSVVWKGSAEESLAKVWLESSDRAKITKAARKIDQALKHDADEQGESRFSNIRILIVPPLGVYFSATAQDRLARVLHVWKFDDTPRNQR